MRLVPVTEQLNKIIAELCGKFGKVLVNEEEVLIIEDFQCIKQILKILNGLKQCK